MRKIILLIVGLMLTFKLVSQPKVRNFYTLMLAIPKETDESKELIKRKSLGIVEVHNKPIYKVSTRYQKVYKQIGKDIDSLGIINYKNDTVYILRIENPCVIGGFDMMIKTTSNNLSFYNFPAKNKGPYKYIKLLKGAHRIFPPFITERLFSNWSVNELRALMQEYGNDPCDIIIPAPSELIERFIIKDSKLISRGEI